MFSFRKFKVLNYPKVSARVSVRRQLVVLHHRNSVAQFKQAGAGDFFAGLQSSFHADKIAARTTGFDKLLARDQTSGAVRVRRFVFNDVNRIAKRRGENGRRGNDQNIFIARQNDLDRGQTFRRAKVFLYYQTSPANGRCG